MRGQRLIPPSQVILHGHRWTFSESVADVDPRDWGGSLVADADGA